MGRSSATVLRSSNVHWSPGVKYRVGQEVLVGKLNFRCAVTHVSSSLFSEDLREISGDLIWRCTSSGADVVKYPSHSLSVGDLVYHKPTTDSWEYADILTATDYVTQFVAFVSEDFFVAVNFGRIEIPSHGLGVRGNRYLDEIIPNTISTEEPSFGYKNPIIYVQDEDNIWVLPFAPVPYIDGVYSGLNNFITYTKDAEPSKEALNSSQIVINTNSAPVNIYLPDVGVNDFVKAHIYVTGDNEAIILPNFGDTIDETSELVLNNKESIEIEYYFGDWIITGGVMRTIEIGQNTLDSLDDKYSNLLAELRLINILIQEETGLGKDLTLEDIKQDLEGEL